ncbi:stage III sporulation protein AH [Siminovitchia fortis]|uniref:Stage III sporulation protein AH n=1 Tax=Siminovitchia fortis TaxID=254758 RepID=A0A443IUX3_9BACI|nr:stage III sporulation protein AH [Siminovitchia fortis]RWR11885.1 stage III sporulation protein AH [Siminovitchia fortis]WHY81833.1 stage III sporulation protein AH [Siminovitchia fortis]
MIFIEKDPQGKVYEQLIDLAFDICDEFHLVVRKDLGSTRKLQPVLKELEGSLKVMKKTNEWTGTILVGGQKAKVYYYHTDDYAREVVKKTANSLHSWLQPDLPEDLSFLKKGKPWLVNIAHEEESYIVTESEYLIGKIKEIEGLEISMES